MKKQLPLAIALGAGLMAFASVATVRAEPDNPGLPRCIGCPIFVFKDTNADGVYDTRVRQDLGVAQPDTLTTATGLWQLAAPSLEASDLYIVIRPNFEIVGKKLIGGDLKTGLYPNGTAYNGVPTALWEDTSPISGIFGDAQDTLYDSDTSTCAYRPAFCGDYRLWIRVSPPQKAIVLHIDNVIPNHSNIHGFIWEQVRPDKAPPPDS